MRLRTADISVIFVSHGTKRRCGACVHAATHTNNEISLPQDNTVMHAWPDSVAPTASPAESYTPNNCYRGKLHVPCVPLRNSAVTLLSLARNTHYGLRIIRASFFFYNEHATRYRSKTVGDYDPFDYWRRRNRKQPRKLGNRDAGHREYDLHALYRSPTNTNTLRDVCISMNYTYKTTIA